MWVHTFCPAPLGIIASSFCAPFHFPSVWVCPFQYSLPLCNSLLICKDRANCYSSCRAKIVNREITWVYGVFLWFQSVFIPKTVISWIVNFKLHTWMVIFPKSPVYLLENLFHIIIVFEIALNFHRAPFCTVIVIFLSTIQSQTFGYWVQKGFWNI